MVPFAGYELPVQYSAGPNREHRSVRTAAGVFDIDHMGQFSLSGKDARPISIIGISKIGGEFLQRSLQEGPGLMLNFMALISIFLGISNLLPIPALDGGRIVFVLLEIVRGKAIHPRAEARIHQIGIMVLLVLGVIVMVYDLINPPSIP
jgi:regulator of sigma E protease